MGRRRKKKHGVGGTEAIDLNVMPLIDIFSLLTTFLLLSAVFVSVGIVEVQIPFLSNAQLAEKSKPVRSMAIKAAIEKKKITITSNFNLPPENEQVKNFSTSKKGRRKMHNYLVDLAQKSPKTETVTVFVEPEVKYELMIDIIDMIKLRLPGDSKIRGRANTRKDPLVKEDYIFPNIVMGSILL